MDEERAPSDDGGYRACDTCRRLKVRCVNRARPPCKRCEHLGILCTSNSIGPVRRRPDPARRLSTVEAEIRGVNGKLQTILSSLDKIGSSSDRITDRNPITQTSLPYIAPEPRVSFLNPSTISPTRIEIIHPISGSTTATTSGAPAAQSEVEVSPATGGQMDEEPVLASAAYFRSLLRIQNERNVENGTSTSDLRLEWWMGTEDLSLQEVNAIVSDPVALEICDLNTAQHLFDFYFQHLQAYIPIFDPTVDTWLNLRQRSPFAITTILFTAAKVSNAEGWLVKRLRTQALRMAKTTLFSHVADLETVQALMILACWAEPYWRMIHHAISLALELELSDCLRQIQHPSPDQDHRRIAAGARVWVATCKLALEAATNHSRMSFFNVTLLGDNLSLLLDSPAALPSDARLVSCCEFQIIRRPVDTLLRQASPSDPLPLKEIRKWYTDAELWQSKWSRWYLRRGYTKDHFYVTELETQRCYSTVFFTSCLLRSTKVSRDVDELDPEQQYWLHRGLTAGEMVIARVAEGKEIEHLPYANHYAHVCLAVTLQVVIRLVKLMPYAVDLRQTATRMQKLVEFLAQLPGVGFGESLFGILERAREEHVLPQRSRVASPKNGVQEALPVNPSFVEGLLTDWDIAQGWDINSLLGLLPDGQAVPPIEDHTYSM